MQIWKFYGKTFKKQESLLWDLDSFYSKLVFDSKHISGFRMIRESLEYKLCRKTIFYIDRELKKPPIWEKNCPKLVNRNFCTISRRNFNKNDSKLDKNLRKFLVGTFLFKKLNGFCHVHFAICALMRLLLTPRYFISTKQQAKRTLVRQHLPIKINSNNRRFSNIPSSKTFSWYHLIKSNESTCSSFESRHKLCFLTLYNKNTPRYIFSNTKINSVLWIIWAVRSVPTWAIRGLFLMFLSC